VDGVTLSVLRSTDPQVKSKAELIYYSKLLLAGPRQGQEKPHTMMVSEEEEGGGGDVVLFFVFARALRNFVWRDVGARAAHTRREVWK
jgi:hypothetical protein